MLNESELRKLADKALGMVAGYEADLILSSADSALTRFSENIITQNVANSGVSFSIRLLKDGKMGKSATGNTTEDGIAKCIDAAKTALEISEPDSDLLPLMGQQEYQEKKDSYFKNTHELTPETRSENVVKAAQACAKDNLEAAGIFSNGGSGMALANTKGLWAYHNSSRVSINLSAMSKDSSGWCDDSDAQIEKLETEHVIDKAIRIANMARKPSEIEPGAYTVILEPAAVADLLMFLGWDALNGLSFAEGRSCFAGKVGEKVVGDNITLVDDFMHPLTPGRPFDFEGMPRQKVTLIENGIFKSTVHDRKTAKLLDLQSTGHAMPQPDPWGPTPLNLVLQPGDSTLDDMISSTDKGLLVTRFHYTNILNPMTMSLTGMTRDGFFMVENGEVTKGLKNMRFTESVLQVLSNVAAMTKDLYKTETFWGGGGTVVPAMKVNDFHFTSKTEN